MILVLEPVDYTLNYYLHSNKEMVQIEPVHTIMIAQQIAAAAQYLHQFGWIHSNISSHCVLMSNHRNGGQFNAKLSSFELVTNVNVDAVIKDIASVFDQHQPSSQLNSDTSSGYSFVKNRKKTLKERYQQRSRELYVAEDSIRQDRSYLTVLSAHLPYHLNYRRHLSQYNYQPLELMHPVQFPNIPFVFPTISSDLYGCTLLLWEMLNKCVPYAIHDATELRQMFQKRQAHLPILEKERCRRFVDLFTVGLEIDVRKRRMQMDEFIQRLDVVKDDLRGETVYANTTPMMTQEPPSSPFRKDKPLPPIPLTSAQIKLLQQQQQSTLSKDGNNATMYQSLLEFNKFLLLGSANGERTSTLKKKKKMKRDDGGPSKLTTKELFSCNQNRAENENAVPKATDQKDVIGSVIVRERHLPTKIQIKHEKTKFLDRLLLNDKSNSKQSTTSLQQASSPLDASKSVGNLLDDSSPPPTNRTLNEATKNRRHNDLIKSAPPPSASYRFAIGEFALPKTPIARKNKIRRNAWLSDHHISVNDEQAVEKALEPSSNNKRVNVSIKIVHNKVSPIKNEESPHTSTTNNQENIKEIPDLLTNDATPPIYYDRIPLTPHQLIVPVDNDDISAEYNKCLTTSRPENVTVDFQNIVNDCLAAMPAATANTSAAIDDKKNKPIKNGDFKKCWRREKSICDKSIAAVEEVVPLIAITTDDENPLTPVKAAILQFENWLANGKSSTNSTLNSPALSSAPSKINSPAPSYDAPSTNGIHKTANKAAILNDQNKNETTPVRSVQQQVQQQGTNQTMIRRTIYSESVITGDEQKSGKSAEQRAETITKAITAAPSSGRKLMTTCVTLNLRQRRRRSSDLGLTNEGSTETGGRSGMTLAMNAETRHSICSPDIRGLTVERANSVINGAMMSSLGRPKYICCNCAKVMNRDEIKACKCMNYKI